MLTPCCLLLFTPDHLYRSDPQNFIVITVAAGTSPLHCEHIGGHGKFHKAISIYLLNVGEGWFSWNNGKEAPRLDLTSSTTPGQQIHKFNHTWTANPCDWLPCRCAALPLVGCPHSLVYLHLPVVEELIFCNSATPHLGTSFPLFHGCTCTCCHDLVAECCCPETAPG